MSKYLKLNFRNAGFFNVNKDTKDYVFDLNGQQKRKDVFYGKQQKVSISVNQISNMLHVLLGERPSPTYRETLIETIDSIFKIAEKALIKIDTPIYVNKNGVKYYQGETLTTKKAVYNSYSTAPEVYYWKRIENRLGEHFNKFTVVLSKILGYDVLSKPLKDVIKDGKKICPNSNEFSELESKISGNTAIFRLFNGFETDISMNKYPETLLTVNFGVEKIIRLDGSIIIPVEDWVIDKLRNNKGVATLLEDGVIYIDCLEDGNFIGEDFFNGYININDLEQYENNN
jgi:hypothetical protein